MVVDSLATCAEALLIQADALQSQVLVVELQVLMLYS